MIPQAMLIQLQPVIRRKRMWVLSRRLAAVWTTACVLGLGLILLDLVLGWRSVSLCILAAIAATAATIAVFLAHHRQRPDYVQIARQIEQRHPELKALLLTAVEQRPHGPEERLGYLQLRVIMEAIGHAATHDWAESIPRYKLAMAQISAMVSLLALTAVWSVLFGLATRPGPGIGLLSRSYRVIVEPGDTAVEAGSSVAVTARFIGRVPPEVSMAFGPPSGLQVTRPMAKNLDDPIFATLLTQVDTDLVYTIKYAGQASGPYTITTYTHPELLRADVYISYPEYAGRGSRHMVDPRVIEAPEGSDITMELEINKPVAMASLAAEHGPGLHLQPVQPQQTGGAASRWVGSLTAQTDGRYRLELLDQANRHSRLKETFTIKVLPNQRPRIRASFPGQDMEVSSIQEVPLEAQVWDDYNVVTCGLTYARPGLEPVDIRLAPEGSQAQAQGLKYLLDLEPMGLQPDQLISYWFWANDLGPDGKVRRTLSPIYFLEVRPFELAFYEGTGSADQQSDSQDGMSGRQQSDPQLLELQKQIITATWSARHRSMAAGTDPNAQEIQTIAQAQSHVMDMTLSEAAQAQNPEAASNLEAAASHMELAVDRLEQAAAGSQSERLEAALEQEQAAYQRLLATRARQTTVAWSRQPQRSAQRQMYQQQLRQLQLRFRQDMYQTARTVQPQRQDSEETELLGRLRDLADRQGRVARQLRESQAALEQAQDQQQTQQALRQLSRLRDEQMQALGDLDQIRQQMDRPQNRQRTAQFQEQVQQTRQRISQSAQQLQEGRVSDAIASATRAQRQLEQIQQQIQQAPSGQLARDLQELRDQVRQVEGQQQQIGRRLAQQLSATSRSLEDAQVYRNIADQLDQQSLQVEELTDRIRQVTDRAEQVEPLLARTLYRAVRQAATGRLSQQLGLAAQLLRRDLLGQAAEVQSRASDQIGQLRTQVEQAAEDLLGDRTNALRAAHDRLDGLIGQLDLSATDPNGAEAGIDLAQWLEDLRQVELILPNQELQQRATALIDSIVGADRQIMRHTEGPRWELLADLARRPLMELRAQVAYELARISGGELVPIDRDPVPGPYMEIVRRYFEELGRSE